MLGKISSNLVKLNKLNETYKWIPNSDSIRPENKLPKNEYLIKLENKFGSIYKGILNEIFNLKDSKPSKKFVINKFRYNTNGEHYVMWYLGYDKDILTDDIINMDIFCNIYSIISNNNFNFAWYENPKPTISNIYHVQVFWTVI